MTSHNNMKPEGQQANFYLWVNDLNRYHAGDLPWQYDSYDYVRNILSTHNLYDCIIFNSFPKEWFKTCGVLHFMKGSQMTFHSI